MKKYIRILLVTALLAGLITGCKKTNSATPNDTAAYIKDKTWSGALTYTGKTTEYYGVHFNADNTLIWVQLSGEYTGHWAINGKTITMTFDATTAKIVADISVDNEWLNITDNTGAYEINSGVLIVNPNIPLDNTVWKGSEKNTMTNATNALQLSFKPGDLVELKSGNTIVGTYSYSRKAAGAAIYVAGRFLGVLMSGAEMKGSDGNAAFPWQAIKQ
jgi:hypothetical protein